MPNETPRRWWPAFVAVASIAPLAPALLPGRTLAWRDTAGLLVPVRTLVVEALRELRLPLWNPLEGTGHPLFAELIHGVLHPVSLLGAAVGAGTDLLLLSYVAFAAAGTWFAARTLACSRAAATGGAFAFALSGYVVGMTGNAQYLAGVATLPWMVGGAIAASRHGARGAVACAAAVACAVFAGDPQAVAVGLGIGLVAGAWEDRGRSAPRILAGQALGLLLSAVQLLPAIAQLALSTRTERLFGGGMHTTWALDPARLVELVSPSFFTGRITAYPQPVYQALGSQATFPLPWAPSVFVGTATLVLALSAWPARRARPLLLLAPLLLWLAMGPHLGAQQLLLDVPVWGRFLFAEKLVGPLTLCFALAAAVAIDEAPGGRALPRLTIAAMAAALGILLVLLLAWRPISGALEARRVGAEAAALIRSRLGLGMLHALVTASALLALDAWRRRKGGSIRWGLAALLFAQGASVAWLAVHWGRSEALSTCPPPLEAPPPGPRILTGIVHNATPQDGALDPIDAFTAAMGRLGLASQNVGCGVDGLEVYSGFAPQRTLAALGSADRRYRLAGRYGVTHVLSESPANPAEAGLLFQALQDARVVSLGADLGVWSIPHRPWASFATSIVLAGSPGAAIEAVERLQAARNPAVVLESDGAFATGPGRVLGVRRGRQDLGVIAESEGDGLLVVNDAWHPGWRATIDGVEVPVIPADALVRAVRWPAGRHTLEMRFAPREVAWGLGLTLAAALGCGAILLFGFPTLRRRAPARPPEG